MNSPQSPRMIKHTKRLVLFILWIPFLQSQEIPQALGQTTSHYEDVISPLLEKHCAGCHGPLKQKSEYRVDLVERLFKGGDSETIAITPGDLQKSYLIEKIFSQDEDDVMPPVKKPPLTLVEKKILEKWVSDGAHVPERIVKEQSKPIELKYIYKTVKRPDLPKIKSDWAQTPVDTFIVAKQLEHNFLPSARAEEQTLIRRMYLVMTGLLPSPEAVKEFVEDTNPDAYNNLIEKILKSPHYGEKWGQHWLDVVRYADTTGFETNSYRPHSWNYRDYVIKSFNDDKPYNQFVKEQIVGDALKVPEATGFIVAGGNDTTKSQNKIVARKQHLDEIDDMITATGNAFMGMTIGCARCHDHKFDHISNKDYYAFSAFFSGVERGKKKKEKKPDPAVDKKQNDNTAKAKEKQKKRETPTPILTKGGAIFPAGTPPQTHRLHRGDPDPKSKRELVSPDIFEVLNKPLKLNSNSSSRERRMALANWLASEKNPFTARVIVNRLWHYHFGQGLVRTTNDFGDSGSLPTHSKLLDWLASELMENNWSLKHVHRLILKSATWQQNSTVNDDYYKIDQGNNYLWRWSPRRMDAEDIRDNILLCSDKLDKTPGGKGFMIYETHVKNVKVYKLLTTQNKEQWRRMVYMFKVRVVNTGTFDIFDRPSAGASCGNRPFTTTPLQALNLFNSDFVKQHSSFIVTRLSSQNTLGRKVKMAYDLILGRHPDTVEMSKAKEFINEFDTEQFVRVLLNSNEFITVP